MDNFEDRVHYLRDKIIAAGEKPLSMEISGWRLKNNSKPTDIKTWTQGIKKFTEQNRKVLIEEVNNIGRKF